jgi:hypothetical protein
MAKKFCLVFLAVFIGLGSVCVFGQSKDPNAAEVVSRYKESLSWQKSVSMKVCIESKVETDGERQPGIIQRQITFRRDHERAEWLGKKLHIIDDNNTVDLDMSFVIKTIMNGDTYADLICGLERPPVVASINRDKEFYNNTLNKLLRDIANGGPLWGRIWGSNDKNVADLLIESANAQIGKKQEIIDGTSCYVVEATTRYGKVTAWISPEKNYSALKWSIQKKPGDLFNQKPLSVDSWLAEFVADDLQKVGDFWVTTAGCLTLRIDYSHESQQKTRISIYKYNVSDIQINPDFEALGAFKIDFPNGTPVQIEQAPGIRYIWQNGKIMPAEDPAFEEIDKRRKCKIVEELKKERQ